MMKEELKEWTQQGNTVTAKGETRSEFRSLQADLNQYAQAVNFEPVVVDGVIGARTTEAVQKTVAAVLAKNSLLVPAEFTYDGVDHVAKYAARIRDWLHSTAATTLSVNPYKVYVKGAGNDWNIKGDIAYGAGAVHDQFLQLQRTLNTLADVVGFGKLEVDGFIGAKTAAAVFATYEKLKAKNAIYGVTLFPPPDTKEETAEYAAFITDWLEKIAIKQLVAETGA
ncbi:MAG: peptidoglycan-binding domain-containing protein [Kofleriaceae bacterium]